ncbi:pro-neuregulin-1, membrane-bound isoform isoform X2 [Nelusetta ayraudi]|uniref:pro-neuregulin-1, membrane-bound isoform isoform X2 n=1 Tax=Nelusetta ayraudi TaxID=303726 RepID=UPI003F6E9887
MTEGIEDQSAGPTPPPGSTSPTNCTVDTGQFPKEKPEETEEAAGESGEKEEEEEKEEERAEGTAGDGDGGDDDGGRLGAAAMVALPGACCVCVQMEQVNNCLHSEKICILPILACLLSLALCTAGLKWVFVDKIFEYEPPTHLDPKRIGQDPIIMVSAEPTFGPMSPRSTASSSSTASLTTSSSSSASSTAAGGATQGHPDVFVEDGRSTRRPYAPQPPRATQSDPSVTLKYNDRYPKLTPPPQTTQESNNIVIPTFSATSTVAVTTSKSSSHVTRCSDSQRNYCVNGGECFTLEIMPGSTKFLCRCPDEFTGDRCQTYVMASFYTEELYQKRILTITGICIALLVVGIMCVVAYCKTKKQRRKLHDRLRQSLKNKRNKSSTCNGHNQASSTRGRPTSNLPLQDLQLVNQCNGTNMHAAEEESETTFSTTKYALAGHDATTFTHISSQRFDSSATTPPCLSADSQVSLATPGSPPSETSAPLSSLAISVPSVALSPSGEEERPLLLSSSNKGQPRHCSGGDDRKRSSVHYNHGHVAEDSVPPSPLFAMENGEQQVNGGGGDHHDVAAATYIFSAALSEQLLNANNNIGDDDLEKAPWCDGRLVGDAEEPQGQHNPLFSAESTAAALLLRAMYSSRTNPATANSALHIQSTGSTAQHDPITA